MFRGINAVNKQPPYYFNLMLNQTIVKELAALGMNIIRLGNMWNGWQPIGPDSFDNTYVDIIEVNYMGQFKVISLLVFSIS